jgi:hypothetical protein
MQISDLVGKYSGNLTNGTEELGSARSTDKMAQAVRELEPGSVFEGTVSQAKNGRVTLALGNGQTIDARLDAGVNITAGRSMFFQVKSNDGETIALKPYSGAGGNGGNPVLLNALTAAQVPVTERNLAMVDAMMQKQMPIDKLNIQDMVRTVNMNQSVNVDTIVSLAKAGLPVNGTMAAQFENYMDGKQAITDALLETSGQYIELLNDESLTGEQKISLFLSFAEIFTEDGDAGAMTGMPADGETPDGTVTQTSGNLQVISDSETASINQGADNAETTNINLENADLEATGTVETTSVDSGTDAGIKTSTATNPVADNAETTNINPTNTNSEATGTAETTSADPEAISTVETTNTDPEAISTVETTNASSGIDTSKTTDVNPLAINSATTDATITYSATTNSTTTAATATADAHTIGEILGDDGMAKLNSILDQETAADYHITFDKNMTAEEFVRLISSKEMQAVMKNIADKQWTIKPDELREDARLNNLYEKIDRQLSQMETAVKAAGVEQNVFSQTVAQAQGNIDFMNQVNQLYSYVQIPLQLSGQNANGELYVYTNGRRRVDPDSELTAFLHLDMDNLGSTDVSVRMKGKKVSTKFYLTDDVSYDLVEKNLPILQKHLEDKGYNCTITMSGEREPAASMEHMLFGQNQERQGIMHRYSFDVRA